MDTKNEDTRLQLPAIKNDKLVRRFKKKKKAMSFKHMYRNIENNFEEEIDVLKKSYSKQDEWFVTTSESSLPLIVSRSNKPEVVMMRQKLSDLSLPLELPPLLTARSSRERIKASLNTTKPIKSCRSRHDQVTLLYSQYQRNWVVIYPCTCVFIVEAAGKLKLYGRSKLSVTSPEQLLAFFSSGSWKIPPCCSNGSNSAHSL